MYTPVSRSALLHAPPASIASQEADIFDNIFYDLVLFYNLVSPSPVYTPVSAPPASMASRKAMCRERASFVLQQYNDSKSARDRMIYEASV